MSRCSLCKHLVNCSLWALLEETHSRWHTDITPVDMRVHCFGDVAEATMWERGVGPETRFVVFRYCLVCESVIEIVCSNVSEVIFPRRESRCEHWRKWYENRAHTIGLSDVRERLRSDDSKR